VRWQWTITDWYRSQWYFEQSAWRGTWNGEGGGLLVNQCPHQLDLVTHLFGPPTRVLANVRRGKHHHITVEDEVHAVMDHANGATGCFIASTGEPCGTNRLEIVGDRGVIRVTAEDRYELISYATPASVHTATSQHRNAPPEYTTQTITVGGHEDEYRDVLANFIEACDVRQKPLASVADARGSIELANAILLSGETGRSVTLPVDRAAVAELLARLQREEREREGRDRSGGPR
jgi:predicted dehydrogenase